MKLHQQSYGDENGRPLLIVHGLFGSGKNWRALARNFARTRHVVTVDMRNHGQSPRSDQNSYFDMAEDLASCIDDLGGTVDLLGHSMGGKAAMVVALQHPEMVRSLVVGDIAPVTYAHSQSENIHIMQKLPLSDLTRRSEAQKQLAALTGDAALAAFFAQSLDFQDGRPNWLLNLSALDANMEAIIGFPDIQGHYDGPVLVARGGASEYVDDVGIQAFKALFTNMQVETMAGAGHWLHADNPHEFIAMVERFLPAPDAV